MNCQAFISPIKHLDRPGTENYNRSTYVDLNAVDPMPIELTERQKSILSFLKDFLRKMGYPPTVREIASHFKMAGPKGAKKHLDRLAAKGYIKKLPGCSRAIEILADSPLTPARMIPIVGEVRAGSPILAEERIEDHLAIDEDLVSGKEVFLLRVKGNSMVQTGILEGDLVLVRSQSTAENGEIVVALVGDESTVKRFYRSKDHIRLEPANDRFKPIVIAPNSGDFRILGKVVGLIRRSVR
jgi:repressor LexA